MNTGSRVLGRLLGLARAITPALALCASMGCSAAPEDATDIGPPLAAFETPMDDVATVQQAAAGDSRGAPVPAFSGIWKPGSANQVVKFDQTTSQFVTDFTTQTNAGLRLLSLSSNVVAAQVRYSAVWAPGTAQQGARIGMNLAQFNTEFTSFWNSGYRLTSLSTHSDGTTVFHNAIWGPSTAPQGMTAERTATDFTASNTSFQNSGLRLAGMSVSVTNGQARFSGFWNSGTTTHHLFLNRTVAQFLADTGTEMQAGFRLKLLSISSLNGDGVFHAVYEQGTTSTAMAVQLQVTDFAAQDASNRAAGLRLTELLSNAEAVNITKVAAKIGTALTSHVTGFSTTVAAGFLRAQATGGVRRTSVDPPTRSYDNLARQNAASVSKTITAVGVQQLLTTRGLTLDSFVTGFLPTNWVRGPLVNTITFRELLGHRSGFRVMDGGLCGFNDLKTMVAGGVTQADKNVQLYQNQNYALFRIIIPYLDGFSEANVPNLDTATSTRFLTYMNQHVFAPATIATVAMTPPASEPSLAYPFPAGATHGVNFGDATTTGGASGFHLSTEDLAKFLVFRSTGVLLTSTQRISLDNGLLGWDGQALVHRGNALFKWGGIGTTQQFISLAVSISNEIQTAILMNSLPSGVDAVQAVVNAYNSSWDIVY